MTLISAPKTPGMADRVSLMAASTKHCWPVPVSLMLLWLEIPTFSSMSLSRRSSWILTPSSSLEKVRLLWECAKNVHWLWITASKWIYAACILISILFCHILFLIYFLFLRFVLFVLFAEGWGPFGPPALYKNRHKHKPKNTIHPIVT